MPLEDEVKGPKILIVEDEKPVADYMESVLSRAGYHVIRTNSPTDAFEKVVQTKPDLILFEIGNLNDDSSFDPVEAANLSETVNPKGKIVYILSNGAAESLPERVTDSKPDGYVRKPIMEEVLLDVVKKVLKN